MDSFKVYLPSNACPDLFPDNTPTHFKTRLNKVIELDDKQWEVGVENIAYSSRINDDQERVEIHCSVKGKKVFKLNDNYPYKFNLNSNGSWKGFEGVMPSVYGKDPTNIKKIVETLNYMCHLILDKNRITKSYKSYEFTVNDKNEVEYQNYDEYLVIGLTPRLTKLLGFGFNSIFYGPHPIKGEKCPVEKKPLTKEDFKVRYFCSFLQTRIDRFWIKDNDIEFDGKEETLIQMIKKVLPDSLKIIPEFKNGKLIFHSYREDLVIVFSVDFRWTYGQLACLIGKGSHWAIRKSKLEAGHMKSIWFIDVFTKEMETYSENIYRDFNLHVYPWRSKSIIHAMGDINKEVKKKVNSILKELYDENKHCFELSLETTNHCRLTLGPWLKIKFDSNLAYLLGFSNLNFEKEREISAREVDILSNHSRQLHVLSNVIQPTAYGERHQPILCDFLHKYTNEPTIMKHFQPISFHPVIRNYIDTIELSLVNETYEVINIKDSKTLVTLYFRRRQV